MSITRKRPLPPPQPAHIPTVESKAAVSALVSYGITQEQIATYLNVCTKTIQRHYRYELDNALISANAAVARVLFKKATVDEDSASVFFWLKTRGGYRETNRHEIANADEKPFEVSQKHEIVDESLKSRLNEILTRKVKKDDRDEPK